MKFENLKCNKVKCFGWQQSSTFDWCNLVKQAQNSSWSKIDVKNLAKSLQQNVEQSYAHLFEMKFVNLDDDINYTCFFDNKKRLFDLILTDSKQKDDLLDGQKKEFFRTDFFKKAKKKAIDFITDAMKLYKTTVKQHIGEEEFIMNLDEVKIEAIESMLADQQLLQNFREGKYLK